MENIPSHFLSPAGCGLKSASASPLCGFISEQVQTLPRERRCLDPGLHTKLVVEKSRGVGELDEAIAREPQSRSGKFVGDRIWIWRGTYDPVGAHNLAVVIVCLQVT